MQKIQPGIKLGTVMLDPELARRAAEIADTEMNTRGPHLEAVVELASHCALFEEEIKTAKRVGFRAAAFASPN